MIHLIVWLSGWIGLGFLISKKTDSTVTIVGGGLIASLVLLIFLNGPINHMFYKPSWNLSGVKTESPSPSYTAKWYEGGNLHTSRVKQWKEAAYNNKLATATDWALSVSKIKKAITDSGNIDNTKTYASQLVSCIDAAVSRGNYTDPNGNSEIATLCILNLGWMN